MFAPLSAEDIERIRSGKDESIKAMKAMYAKVMFPSPPKILHGISDVCAVFATKGFKINGELVPREVAWCDINEHATPRLVYTDNLSEYPKEEAVEINKESHHDDKKNDVDYILQENRKKGYSPMSPSSDLIKFFPATYYEAVKTNKHLGQNYTVHGLQYELLDYEKNGIVPVIKPSNVKKYIYDMYQPTPTKYLVGYLNNYDKDLLYTAGVPGINLTELGKDRIAEFDLLRYDKPDKPYMCKSHVHIDSGENMCAAQVVKDVKHQIILRLTSK